MATTNLNVRIDETVKKQAEQIFNEIGLNLSTAINVFLKQSIRERGIPFEMKLNSPNAETLMAISNIENGKNLKGPFNSVADLMEDLNADD